MQIYYYEWESTFENEFFSCQGIFFRNFDFKNECKNEFEDNNEKLLSWSRKAVSHKFYFTTVWTHESMPTTLELNLGYARVEKVQCWSRNWNTRFAQLIQKLILNEGDKKIMCIPYTYMCRTIVGLCVIRSSFFGFAQIGLGANPPKLYPNYFNLEPSL